MISFILLIIFYRLGIRRRNDLETAVAFWAARQLPCLSDESQSGETKKASHYSRRKRPWFGCRPPVYGWFTEGFDTRDLKEAKALLDDLVS
jgi:hypothetical protein